MKNLIRNITAKKQIMLIIGAVMLTVIIITVSASFSIYSRAAVRDVDSRMALQMDYAARNLDNQLEEYTSSIMSLYLNSSFQELLETELGEMGYAERQSVVRRIRNIVNSEMSRYTYVPAAHIYMRAGNGYIAFDREGGWLAEDETEAPGEWFEDVCSYGRRVVRWSVFEKTGDKNGEVWLSCAFKLKLRPDGEPAVVARLMQRLKYVLVNVCSSFDTSSGDFFLLDSEDNIIYAEGAEGRAVGAELERTLARGFEGESGGVRISGAGGQRSVYWKKYGKLGWTLVYAAQDGTFRRYRQTLPVYAAISVAVIAVAVGLLLFSSKILTGRLVRLSDAVGRISRDRLTLDDDVSGEDEVGRLAESFRSILEMARGLIAEKGRVEKEKYAIELQALQERINPHFLYNTISTISAMAQQIEAYDISEALYALADFYRLSLSHGSSLITLGDELKILSVYLDICRTRFGENMRIVVDAEEDCENCLVPKLIIQPFIENAIMHGVDITTSDDNEIRVEIRREDAELAIYITDNGNGMDKEQISRVFRESPDGKLHAIKNIDRRIKLRYGEAYGVTIKSAPGEGTQVKLSLPFTEHGGES